MRALIAELVAAGLPGDDAGRVATNTYHRTAGGMVDALVEAYAADCDRLAPILVRHAAPSVRFTILRELLGSMQREHFIALNGDLKPPFVAEVYHGDPTVAALIERHGGNDAN